MKINLTHEDRLVIILDEFPTGELFDEWSLTVKAWEIYPEHYGLRGYEEKYPDHKKVCNIYQKPGGPKAKGYIKKVDKNYYIKLPGATLRSQEISSKETGESPLLMAPEAMRRLVKVKKSRAYIAYLKNGSIPNDWNAAASFLEVSMPTDLRGGLGIDSKKFGDGDRNQNIGSVKILKETISLGIELCNSHDLANIAETSSGKFEITKDELTRMSEVFNYLLEKWNKALNIIGINNIEQMIIRNGETDE